MHYFCYIINNICFSVINTAKNNVAASPSSRLTQTIFPLKEYGEIRTSDPVLYHSKSQKRRFSQERLGPADVPTKIKKSQEDNRSLASKPMYSRNREIKPNRTHFWGKFIEIVIFY